MSLRTVGEMVHQRFAALLPGLTDLSARGGGTLRPTLGHARGGATVGDARCGAIVRRALGDARGGATVGDARCGGIVRRTLGDAHVRPTLGDARGGRIYGSAVGSVRRGGIFGIGHARGGGLYGSAVGMARGGVLHSTGLGQVRFFSGKRGNGPFKEFLEDILKGFTTWLSKAKASGKEKVDDFVESIVKVISAWLSKARDSGSDIVMPVKEYFEGLRKRLVALYSADSAGTGDVTPLPPRLYMDLLQGVWKKVHSIERTMHLPPAKTKLRVLLDLILEEQKGGVVHRKLVTGEEFYSMIWKVATIVCSVSAYIELKVTPWGAFRLHLRWLANEAKNKIQMSNEQDSDEQLSPGSDDTGSKVDTDSVNSGDCAGCKFCIKICSYFCSDKNAVQSTPPPSPEQKTESDGSALCNAVCSDSDVPLECQNRVMG